MSTEYVVCDFPTIMDGWVVRWFANEAAANNGRPIISASRNGVVKHTPGPDADQLEAVAMDVHDRIARWYGPFGLPDHRATRPWSSVLTHVAHMFQDVEPIAKDRTDV